MSNNPSAPPPTAIPLPLHAAPNNADGSVLTVRRRPGRPKKVATAPKFDIEEREYLDAVVRALGVHVDADVVVQGTRDGRSEDVLRGVLVGLASEAAALRWSIEQGQKEGKDTAQLRSRRIDALHKMALVLLGRRRLGFDELDPQSETMSKVLDLFVRYVGDALEATLPADRAAALIEEVRNSLLGWAATADAL